MRIRSLAAGLIGRVGLVLAADAGNAQQQPQGQLPPITVTPPPAKKKSATPQPKQQPTGPATAQPAAAPQAASPDADAIQSIDPAANAIGKAQSASQGVVLAPELEARPIYRTGELLEATPGLVVTQHSGEGKANQYFLRGFNLDHGTDLAITVDGMPVNMRTHGHGQGYADTNFMIPEIMRGLAYRKGPLLRERGRLLLRRRHLSRRRRPPGEELRAGRDRQLRPSPRGDGHVGAGRPRRHGAGCGRGRALRRALGPSRRAAQAQWARCATPAAATTTASR